MTADEAVTVVLDILKMDCENPAQEIRNHGKVLIQIADALEGKTRGESLAIIKAASHLVTVMPTSK